MVQQQRWMLLGLPFWFLMAAVANGAGDDQDADERAASLLARWAKAAARIEAIDVRFELTMEDEQWGLAERFKGHLLLKKPNLSFLELNEVRTERRKERMLFTDQAIYQFREDLRQEIVFDLPTKRTAVPEVAALPFLFGMNAEDVAKRHELKARRETPASVVVEMKPRLAATRESIGFEKAYIELDPQTFLPRRFYTVAHNGRRLCDYRTVETHVNTAIDPKMFVPVAIPGWEVFRPWDNETLRPILSRLLQ